MFIKWIAAQSFLLASLSQFAAQYDALYGEQFQVGDGLPKELLAEEFVAEKVVELWAALDSIWHDAALLQPAIADGVYR